MFVDLFVDLMHFTLLKKNACKLSFGLFLLIPVGGTPSQAFAPDGRQRGGRISKEELVLFHPGTKAWTWSWLTAFSLTGVPDFLSTVG